MRNSFCRCGRVATTSFTFGSGRVPTCEECVRVLMFNPHAKDPYGAYKARRGMLRRQRFYRAAEWLGVVLIVLLLLGLVIIALDPGLGWFR